MTVTQGSADEATQSDDGRTRVRCLAARVSARLVLVLGGCALIAALESDSSSLLLIAPYWASVIVAAALIEEGGRDRSLPRRLTSIAAVWALAVCAWVFEPVHSSYASAVVAGASVSAGFAAAAQTFRDLVSGGPNLAEALALSSPLPVSAACSLFHVLVWKRLVAGAVVCGGIGGSIAVLLSRSGAGDLALIGGLQGLVVIVAIQGALWGIWVNALFAAADGCATVLTKRCLPRTVD